MLGGKIAIVLTTALVAQAANWKQSTEKDEFNDSVYNAFTLVSDNTLQDVGVSGQAQIKVLCEGGRYFTAFLVSPVNLNTHERTSVQLRIDSKTPLVLWKALKTNVLEIAKGDMRKIAAARTVRMQLIAWTGNPVVAAFTPEHPAELAARCSGLLK